MKNTVVSTLSFLVMYFSIGYVQEIRIYDYGYIINIILGSAPNLIAAAALPLCVCIIKGKDNLYLISSAVSFGLVAYEFSQFFIEWRTFDYYDLLFTIVGFFISITLIKLIFPDERFLFSNTIKLNLRLFR